MASSPRSNVDVGTNKLMYMESIVLCGDAQLGIDQISERTLLLQFLNLSITPNVLSINEKQRKLPRSRQFLQSMTESGTTLAVLIEILLSTKTTITN
mmetsp:Transcript_38627/g.152512  ORF Transcript_38627/g.152512 Transcript_38627/m.152512 type:complete len:97 (+) Transcript_38627:2216-2506(+)